MDNKPEYEHRDLAAYIKIAQREVEIKDKIIVLLFSPRFKQTDFFKPRVFFWRVHSINREEVVWGRWLAVLLQHTIQ